MRDCRFFLPVARLLLACVSVLVVAGTSSHAADIRVFPDKTVLTGPDAVQQLAVDLLQVTDKPVDATPGAAFTSNDTKVAEVDSTGLIVPKGDGTTTVVVRHAGAEARVAVTVRSFAVAPPMNFANEVVPVFTKLGCNSGGCHGKASGQNGFRLSLLGFEPALDFETLTRESRGRRVLPTAPRHSLHTIVPCQGGDL